MSREVRDKLFEPFFTTKAPGKGTGMGLATVYGIVKQSGGHIHVYSEPGRGTTFKIYFPVAEGEAPASARTGTGKIPVAQSRGETLLLVEDEDMVRAYARRVLESLGYKVLPASRGQEALEVAARAEGPIHALVTDVVMPGMSGRDVWEKLKPLHPSMRVLFMSGYADTAIVHHGVLDADAPFLAKPFTPAQLAQKVAEILTPAPQRPAP
jgi:CheY-like chemotaxis protein